MEHTSSSLVRGIADFEDHQRWFEFNHLYRPMIRKILQNKGLSSNDHEDIVQEVYLSLLSTLDHFQYDRDKGQFRSWLSKITQRAVVAHWRRQNHTSVDPQQIDQTYSDDPSLPGIADERMQLCLQLARNRFDAQTWLPFYLCTIEETPIEEVQRITHMNRNAIYQSVHRVKTCLREMLAHLDNRREDQ